MNNMRETLINQLTKEEYDLIVSLGKGEEKLPRYFFLSETESFESGEYYTIYTIRITALNVMDIILQSVRNRDNLIFYNKYEDQSVVGIGEVLDIFMRNHLFLGEQIVPPLKYIMISILLQ